MTDAGLVHNATWDRSRLTPSLLKRFRPKCARSIAYYRDDESSWRATLGAMRDLAELGCYNLLLANTEATGARFMDLDLRQQRLERLLAIARDEFGSCVHGVESDNEVDTGGWDIGDGHTPISADWMARSAIAAADVCAGFGVECIGPSFLGGPATDAFRATTYAMAQHGGFAACAQHYYGKSIGGAPYPGWNFGTMEDAANDSFSVSSGLPIDVTEVGCYSRAGGIGHDAQARFVEAFCAFEHPHVRRLYLFDLNDWVTPDGEYNNGQDWGLIDRDGSDKPSAARFDGGLIVAKPQPAQPVYVLGFRKFAEILRAGGVAVADPRENEFGAWPESQQQWTRDGGLFLWEHLPRGGSLTYLHTDGRRFRWSEDWTTFEQVTAGQPRAA